MNDDILILENNLSFNLKVCQDNHCRLLNFSPIYNKFSSIKNLPNQSFFRILELKTVGENHDEHHGSKHFLTQTADKLFYNSHKIYKNDFGTKLEITLQSEDNLQVVCNYQFYDGISVVRSWCEVKNLGDNVVGIEYITSFALFGLDIGALSSYDQSSYIYLIHNTWANELKPRKYTPSELGLNSVEPLNKIHFNGSMDFSLKRIYCKNTGTWSASEYLPMGAYENVEKNVTYLWQIENQGSWYWEIGDKAGHLYLHLCGPTFDENMWIKWLKPDEVFVSVPVAIACVEGRFEDAVSELTKYRRLIRRKNHDNDTLPVIFNDYMNCLFGDPTEEKLIPLIDAASKAGCEYFVIDAGWYADGFWWDTVGEWIPSEKRFPNGIKKVLDYIRQKGMIPGLWLEIEVMGINNKFANSLPDDWFFMRFGKRVIDHGRYQLDFRNPEVRKYADTIIDRLVNEYGVGYIKMDYNINAGVGTDLNTDSFGDGLLEHNRAYLKWLDSIFERYPNLIIENCSSGGMRMDYALLSRHSIQSSSDQTDFRRYAYISAASPIGVTPEQCAVWAYPLFNADEEEVIFNMVNAILLRIHQSGHLAQMNERNFALIKEGISYYKKIRNNIKNGLAFWPLGIPQVEDKWLSLGLNCGNKIYLAVWKLNADSYICKIPLDLIKGKDVELRCAYPNESKCEYAYHNSGILSVYFDKPYMARLFEITVR